MKRQSNIVAATLNNYERLEEILEISRNSAGSAAKEQERFAQSLQFSLNRLKEAFQALSQTVVDKGFLKTLIESGVTILNLLTKIIDKLGTLPTILGSLAMINGLRGKGKHTEYAYLRVVA